jgi:hypothetical protein
MSSNTNNEWLEKIHYQDDHPSVIREAGYYAKFIDGDAYTTKSASAAFTRKEVDKWKPDKNHFGLHLIAMGSEESVGPNRNGDSWPASALQAYHQTFVKNGCFFREHKNRCQKTQGIGVVKAAAYNEPMSRIELIVWGDKRKAEEEYEMAKAGKEISFSMSARMPYDRCSICDKKSRSQSDYCNDLKENMLQYVPRMKKYAFARNMDDLKFFDISRVGKRADRVATYLRYMFGDDMAKAASFGERVITGADWAAMEFDGQRGLGSGALRSFTPWEMGTLEKLAAAEAELAETGANHLEVVRRGAPTGIPQHVILAFAQHDLPAVGGELAKRAMILDFKSFASLISGIPVVQLSADDTFNKVACGEMPRLFQSLLSLGGCECGDVAPMVAPDEFGCALVKDRDIIDDLINEVGDNLGMQSGRLLSRANRSCEKSASTVERHATDNAAFYRRVVDAYGYYVVKAAHIAKDVDGVSTPVLMLAVPAMNLALG